MNNITRQINKFIKDNPEFEKIRLEGKSIVFYMRGSHGIDFKTGDFSMNSVIRAKLNLLEKELGLPVT